MLVCCLLHYESISNGLLSVSIKARNKQGLPLLELKNSIAWHGLWARPQWGKGHCFQITSGSATAPDPDPTGTKLHIDKDNALLNHTH